MIQLDQPPGLAVSGGKIDTSAGGTSARSQVGQLADELLRLVDASLGLRSAGLGPPPQPLDLAVHSIFQRVLVFGLGVKEGFFFLQKLAVVARDAQESFRIHAVHFDHDGRDVLQKVAVVADDNGGERRGLEKLLQPFNGGQVKMVRGLVQ